MPQNNDDEDWIKVRTWDVRTPDNKLLTHMEDLCPGGMLNRSVLKAWTQLPCWKAAPATLKANVEEYLKETENVNAG